MVVRKIIPCFTMFTVVFTHGSPLAFAYIWSPFSPQRALQAFLFFGHTNYFMNWALNINLINYPYLTAQTKAVRQSDSKGYALILLVLYLLFSKPCRSLAEEL